MRGRKPKPTHLKLIAGNPGHRPLNLHEPMPEGDLHDPPDWFTPRQRILWDLVIRAAPEGLLSVLDSSVLETFVVAKSIHEHAAGMVAEYGSVIKMPGSGQPMRSPYLGILNQQAAVMMKAISEMGFSPSSRSRVDVKRRTTSKGNRFGRLKELKID